MSNNTFSQFLKQLAEFWEKLPRNQRVLLITLGLAIAIVVPVLITWASQPTYTAAFQNLSEADAGVIVERLNEAGIEYQVPEPGTILVPNDMVYEVRMNMAKEGLPEGGTVGYELFSGNTLGMTEFTQRVNYQRALEGELERTIANLDAVEMVRVHIVTPERRLLSSQQAPATASVTIKERTGRKLDLAQVQAITHLIASSVEGMQPENVVVVDVNGTLLSAGLTDESGTGTTMADKQRAAELQVAAEIQQKVQDLLDTSLGPNRSVVKAYVTLDWTERQTTTQSFAPDPESIRSSQTISETYNANGQIVGGVPGSDTNLPPLVEEGVDDETVTTYSRLETTTNFEITSTETTEVYSPGTIERLSLSVLVDGVTDAAQLETLRSVIAAAAGIEETRGDLLAVETLAFDHTYLEEQTAEFEAASNMELYMQIAQVAGAAAILIVLLWYVQRMIGRLRKDAATNWVPVLKPVSEMALPGAAAAYQLGALTGSESPRLTTAQQFAAALSDLGEQTKHDAPQQHAPKIELPKIDLPLEDEFPEIGKASAIPPEEERLTRLVNRLAEQDPARLAEVISMWLSEGKR